MDMIVERVERISRGFDGVTNRLMMKQFACVLLLSCSSSGKGGAGGWGAYSFVACSYQVI